MASSLGLEAIIDPVLGDGGSERVRRRLEKDITSEPIEMGVELDEQSLSEAQDRMQKETRGERIKHKAKSKAKSAAGTAGSLAKKGGKFAGKVAMTKAMRKMGIPATMPQNDIWEKVGDMLPGRSKQSRGTPGPFGGNWDAMPEEYGGTPSPSGGSGGGGGGGGGMGGGGEVVPLLQTQVELQEETLEALEADEFTEGGGSGKGGGIASKLMMIPGAKKAAGIAGGVSLTSLVTKAPLKSLLTKVPAFATLVTAASLSDDLVNGTLGKDDLFESAVDVGSVMTLGAFDNEDVEAAIGTVTLAIGTYQIGSVITGKIGASALGGYFGSIGIGLLLNPLTAGVAAGGLAAYLGTVGINKLIEGEINIMEDYTEDEVDEDSKEEQSTPEGKHSVTPGHTQGQTEFRRPSDGKMVTVDALEDKDVPDNFPSDWGSMTKSERSQWLLDNKDEASQHPYLDDNDTSGGSDNDSGSSGRTGSSGGDGTPDVDPVDPDMPNENNDDVIPGGSDNPFNSYGTSENRAKESNTRTEAKAEVNVNVNNEQDMTQAKEEVKRETDRKLEEKFRELERRMR